VEAKMAKNSSIVQSLSIMNSIAATMENGDKAIDMTESGSEALKKIEKKISKNH
jgi:hypothetical protein